MPISFLNSVEFKQERLKKIDDRTQNLQTVLFQEVWETIFCVFIAEELFGRLDRLPYQNIYIPYNIQFVISNLIIQVLEFGRLQEDSLSALVSFINFFLLARF
mgnify:CR=1 FL=1